MSHLFRTANKATLLSGSKTLQIQQLFKCLTCLEGIPNPSVQEGICDQLTSSISAEGLSSYAKRLSEIVLNMHQFLQCKSAYSARVVSARPWSLRSSRRWLQWRGGRDAGTHTNRPVCGRGGCAANEHCGNYRSEQSRWSFLRPGCLHPGKTGTVLHIPPPGTRLHALVTTH